MRLCLNKSRTRTSLIIVATVLVPWDSEDLVQVVPINFTTKQIHISCQDIWVPLITTFLIRMSVPLCSTNLSCFLIQLDNFWRQWQNLLKIKIEEGKNFIQI